MKKPRDSTFRGAFPYQNKKELHNAVLFYNAALDKNLYFSFC